MGLSWPTEVLGTLGGILVVFAIINSSFANANSGATAATRSMFAMGRGGLLPRSSRRCIRRTGRRSTPCTSRCIVAIVVAVIGGLVLVDDPYPARRGPINIYVFIGTMLGLLFAGMYIAVNLAVIGFYCVSGGTSSTSIKHLMVPILGVIAMIPALLSVIGGLTIPIFDVKLAAYTGSLRFTAPIVGGLDADRRGRLLRAASRDPRGAGRGWARSTAGGDEEAAGDGLAEDRERAVGGDDPVRRVDDLADLQVARHAASR